MSSKILFLWLITAALTLSTTSGARHHIDRRTCHPDDLKALANFKQGIVIDTSARVERWIGHYCCNWAGIFCDENTGRVIALYLPGIAADYSVPAGVTMTGLLSPSITLLAYLQILDLSQAIYLEGIIPPSIGLDLPRLEHLVLNNNRLSGPIPSSIGRLTNLVEFDVAFNMIQGQIPHELSCLRKLDQLNLANNQLRGRIPDQFWKLTNLTWLNLSGNDLEGEIPPIAPFIYFFRQSFEGNRGLCGKPLDPCRS